MTPSVPPDLSTTLPDVTANPASATQLVAEMRRIHAESAAYWQGYPSSEFFSAPAPGIWSAADHVRHLTKSIRAVTKGLRAPRLVLRISFGRSRAPSRSYRTIVETYRAALGKGAKAGRFAPRPLEESERGDEARARVMSQHAEAVESFCGALARWPERSLDSLRLPHPLLGRLTVREMSAFTLYHGVHHVHVAERRRREAR